MVKFGCLKVVPKHHNLRAEVGGILTHSLLFKNNGYLMSVLTPSSNHLLSETCVPFLLICLWFIGKNVLLVFLYAIVLLHVE